MLKHWSFGNLVNSRILNRFHIHSCPTFNKVTGPIAQSFISPYQTFTFTMFFHFLAQHVGLKTPCVLFVPSWLCCANEGSLIKEAAVQIWFVLISAWENHTPKLSPKMIVGLHLLKSAILYAYKWRHLWTLSWSCDWGSRISELTAKSVGSWWTHHVFNSLLTYSPLLMFFSLWHPGSHFSHVSVSLENWSFMLC